MKSLLIFALVTLTSHLTFAKDEKFHILLTPDEASLFDINNFPKEYYKKTEVDEEIKRTRILYGSGFMGSAALFSLFFLKYGYVRLSNFFYQEGVYYGYFDPNLLQTLTQTPPPKQGFFQRARNGFLNMLPGFGHANGAVQGMKQNYAGLKNRWNQKFSSDLDELCSSIASSNKYSGSPVTHAQIQDEVCGQIQVYTWALAATFQVPVQLIQRRLIKNYYYNQRKVHPKQLKDAFKQMKRNADLSCKALGGVRSVGLKRENIKLSRMSPTQMKTGVYFQGEMLTSDHIFDLGGNGTYVGVSHFKCLMNRITRQKKSINRLLKDSVKKQVSAKPEEN